MRNWFESETETLKIIRQGILQTRLPELAHHCYSMFKHAGEGPLTDPIKGLYWSSSSVQAAMELARLMGAAQIFLIGVDYNDRTHAYTGSSAIPQDINDQPVAWPKWEKIVWDFEQIRSACRRTKIKVFNLNPLSALDVFEKITPILPPREPESSEPPVSPNSIVIDFDTKMLEYRKDGECLVCSLDSVGKGIVNIIEKLRSYCEKPQVVPDKSKIESTDKGTQ
jgi:hypothetical protein